MSAWPCAIVIAVTRAWLRFYTLGLPLDIGASRREEIESDLWEMQHDPGISSSWSWAIKAVGRLLAGLADDIGWRMEVTPVPELSTAISSGRGGPSFHIIETRGPKPGSIGVGILTSLLMFASFGLMLRPREFEESPLEFAEGPGPAALVAESDLPRDPGSAAPVVSGTRDHLIASVANLLNLHYFNRDIGWQLAAGILAHQKDGHYDSADTWPELVDRLNRHIHEAGQAAGVAPGAFVADVAYSERSMPSTPPMLGAEAREEHIERLREQNCLFERVETLAQNIGYVKVNGFADPSVCIGTASRIMSGLNDVDALIVDLRDNGGGMGEVALHIAGYLFGRPQFFYDPREHSRVPPFTSSPINDSNLVNTPVYLLTSSKTQSAAEYFVYNMKMLQRATIVGERTAGEQHSGRFFRINDHFGMGIQAMRAPKNPFPIKGWERIGIVPDVFVPSVDSLDEAMKLAVQRIRAVRAGADDNNSSQPLAIQRRTDKQIAERSRFLKSGWACVTQAFAVGAQKRLGWATADGPNRESSNEGPAYAASRMSQLRKSSSAASHPSLVHSEHMGNSRKY